MGTKAESLCNSETISGESIFSQDITEASSSVMILPITMPTDSYGLMSSFKDVVPGRLRLADLEMDGFTDIVVTLETPSGSQT
jgi:hypothetical protein